MIELEYYYFVVPNESMNKGNDHQWLLIPQKETMQQCISRSILLENPLHFHYTFLFHSN